MELEPAVLAALIEGVSIVLAAVIPSAVALIGARKFLSKKQAESTALNALYEIRFLQALEQHLLSTAQMTSQRNKLRSEVFKNTGLASTSAFYPTRLDQKIRSYEARVSSDNPLN